MVHLALVGCGGMGHYHAARLKEIDRVKVTALVDLLPAQTRLYRERYFPDAREYDDYEKLLSDRDLPLDGVVLVTPHTDHYPQAKAALLRGLHVLVEKPMVTGSAQAYDLWKTVKQTGRQLSIAFQSCYTPEFGYLARERDAGRLGRITLVSGWLAQNWLSATAGKWRQNKSASGGGQMYDSGGSVCAAAAVRLACPACGAAEASSASVATVSPANE